MRFAARLALLFILSGWLASSVNGADANATAKPWENSLGMKFVPVAGTEVQFSIWQTRRQDFEAFVKATRYDANSGMLSLTEKPGEWKALGDNWKAPGFEQTGDHPVVGVSQEDAREFCKWLTKKEQTDGPLTASHAYRLPTDAEWSVAVGLQSETGSTPEEKGKDPKNKNVYPWGKRWPPPAKSGNLAGEESTVGPLVWRREAKQFIEGYDDGFPRTAPVGSFAPNKLGLYDLGTNVSEWCDDLYGKTDQLGWVVRGGSWRAAHSVHMFMSSRGGFYANLRRYDIGFRCVLSRSVAASQAASRPAIP